MSATAIALISAGSVLSAGTAAYVGYEMMQTHPEISGETCTDMYGTPIEDAYMDESVRAIQRAIIQNAGIDIIGGDDGEFGQASCIAFGMAQQALDITVDYKFGPESAQALNIGFYDLLPKEMLASDADIAEVDLPRAKQEIECTTMQGEAAETGYTTQAVLTIQNALAEVGYGRGGIDGKFLDLTCDEVVAFQTAMGLTPDGIVGPVTARALGIDYSQLVEHSLVDSVTFDPSIHCPYPASCDIEVNLNTQRLTVKDANGVKLWEIPVQSGKTGYETRNVTGKLGSVEYGENNNPERPSIDYPEAILVNPRGYGGDGQKFHGSYSFNSWAVNRPEVGSAGCIRMDNSDSYVFARMPTGTDVKVHGAKPGTAQK